jgi:hypothetical protein
MMDIAQNGCAADRYELRNGSPSILAISGIAFEDLFAQESGPSGSIEAPQPLEGAIL